MEADLWLMVACVLALVLVGAGILMFVFHWTVNIYVTAFQQGQKYERQRAMFSGVGRWVTLKDTKEHAFLYGTPEELWSKGLQEAIEERKEDPLPPGGSGRFTPVSNQAKPGFFRPAT